MLLAGAWDLRAQDSTPSTNYTLIVKTDRADSLYHRGEKVTFTVALRLDAEPILNAEVQCVLSKDGAPPFQTNRLNLAEGLGTVTGKLDEPGFLQCRVTFRTPARKTIQAVAGAGIDPLQIPPSLPVPEDFDAFWTAQKKKLAEIPINARLSPVESPNPETECFDLQADTMDAPVSGYFARPVSAKPKSLPIILTVHGAGVRSSSLTGAANWAKRGFLALDINAHGLPNGRPSEFYTNAASTELKDYRYRGRESRDTVYFVGMFLRLVHALDFLTAQPEWNGHTVVVHGSSQGGAQAIVAAGLDPRVTFFSAGVPAMCDRTGVAVGRINGWPKIVPNDPDGKPDNQVLKASRYIDAMNFATLAKAGGILTVGFIDTTCPPTSVYAAYNALRGTKTIFNDPPSTHAVSTKANQAMRDAIAQHVGRRVGGQ